MSTQLATTHGTDLTIAEDQIAFTPQQEAALRHAGVNAPAADLTVFFHQCKRTGLDPFARQIYMIARQGKQTIQTGIDGFRLIARRATDATNGTLGYKPTLWMTDQGQWLEVWPFDTAPVAAKVTVIRNGGEFPAIAMFREYAGRKRDGSLTQMWDNRKAGMLAKCAEALALRMAFPQDLSGLYTADEMQQADNHQVIDHGPQQPHRPQQVRQEPLRAPAQEPARQSATDRLAAQLGATPAPAQPDPAATLETWKALIAATDTLEDLQQVYRDAYHHCGDAIIPAKDQRKTELQSAATDDQPIDAELVDDAA